MTQLRVDPRALEELADDLAAAVGGMHDDQPLRRLPAEALGADVLRERLDTFFARTDAALSEIRKDLGVVVPALHQAAGIYAETDTGIASWATPR